MKLENKKYTIFVVDSEVYWCDYFKEALEEEGFKVIVSDNSKYASDLLLAENFELMICDIDLHEKDGLQILKRAKKIRNDLPVIMTSKQTAVDTMISCLNNGADSFLVKPFEKGELSALVKNSLEKRLTAERMKLVSPFIHDKRHLEIPSKVELVPEISQYLVQHMTKLEICQENEVQKMRMAIQAVLNNAIVHGNQNDHTKKVTIDAEYKYKSFTCTISDQGKGFKHSKTPEFGGKRIGGEKKGRGLFLAMTFMDQLLFNEIGNEATLIKKLDNAPKPRSSKNQDLNIEKHDLKILVIDDSRGIREKVIAAMNTEGYSVFEAIDGADGLTKIKEYKPDLVLSDVVMPKIDGLKLCRMVKNSKIGDETYFILLTSQRSVEDKMSGFEMGADDYITKPFNIKELNARVQTGLRLVSLQKTIIQKNKSLAHLNQQIMDDLETAAAIQRGLIPTHFSNIKNANLYSKYIPSYYLGGDYYDVIQLGNGDWGILSADVSGHGFSATFITAMLKMSFHYQSKQNLPPTEVINLLNKDLCQTIITDDFITGFYAVYNENTRRLTWTNAGHPPPILINDHEGDVKRLEGGGLPIGIFAEAKYEEYSMELQPGDKVLFYSDGIIEVVDQNEDYFGRERLESVMVQHRQYPIDEIGDQIENAAVKFCGETVYEDDVSYIILHII